MTRIWPGEWLRQIAQRPIVPVRSEVVQILRLTLPPLAAGQRKAAALFAAEPLIAQPLEEVQVSLGPRLPDDGGPSSWLAVVIARETLARMIAENTRSGARFVPDALFLPRPAVGQWTVALREGRLPVTHQALAAFPVAPDPALSGFDLAEGQTQDWRRPGRIAALLAVLVLGLAAHFAVMGVKVHRARLAADATETQLRDALVKRGVKVGTSVDAAATAAIQAASPLIFMIPTAGKSWTH